MYKTVMYIDDRFIDVYIVSAFNEDDAISIAKSKSTHPTKDYCSWFAKAIHWGDAIEPDRGWYIQVV